jgi:uncharacterized ion transporter superfamily protein YfcC
MKTLALIVLVLLVVWWCVLTALTVSSHRKRVRLAANWTPENEAEYQKLEAEIPHFRIRGRHFIILAPFLIPPILFFLPCYIYGWFVPDPFEKRDKSA